MEWRCVIDLELQNSHFLFRYYGFVFPLGGDRKKRRFSFFLSFFSPPYDVYEKEKKNKRQCRAKRASGRFDLDLDDETGRDCQEK